MFTGSDFSALERFYVLAVVRVLAVSAAVAAAVGFLGYCVWRTIIG